MIRYFRDLRLVPIALIASACLLALKTAGLVLDSGYFFAADNMPAREADAPVIRTTPDLPQAAAGRLSWAQQMFNFPDGKGSAPIPGIARQPGDRANADIITGSVQSVDDGKGDAAANKDPAVVAATTAGKDGKPGKAAPPPNGIIIPTNGAALPSNAERAILERLQERRQELDARARELDIRESLIKAAEKRMDGRLAELKEVEARIKVETGQKDEAELARFKGLVTMYENMKPRDAAKIFDRLEIGVLMKVVSQINPRRMSDIMAQMSPDTAQRLTVELANKAQQHADKTNPNDLPKIEGQPTAP